MDFNQILCDYCASGHSLLSVKTHEKGRAIDAITIAAENIGRDVFSWSTATGWINSDNNIINDNQGKEPDEALQQILSMSEESIFVLRDFDVYLNQSTYSRFDIVLAWLQHILPILSNTKRTVIVLGPDFHCPEVIKHDISFINFDLPGSDHIKKVIDFVLDGVETKDGDKIRVDNKILPDIIDSCRGMTQSQVMDRFALCIRRHKEVNKDMVHSLVKEKANIIQSSNLLSYHDTKYGGLSSVGGYDAVKQHVMLDKPCFTDNARSFGIDPPKGILLVGIPGCGKTLLTEAIASELELPLISMDVANLMDSLVGGSEANMRQALALLESIAPCVLQLDEIEKGFGGSGDLDGGSSRRVFGQFLKWLSTKNNSVYVIATANNIQSLPTEFLRKGRFDEIFGLDLPNENERGEIFKIHISRRDRDPSEFDINKLAKASIDMTGSDIEQVIKHSLKIAFNDNADINTESVLDGIKEIVPLAKIDPERINTLRKWISSHAKSANAVVTKNQNRRVVNV